MRTHGSLTNQHALAMTIQWCNFSQDKLTDFSKLIQHNIKSNWDITRAFTDSKSDYLTSKINLRST